MKTKTKLTLWLFIAKMILVFSLSSCSKDEEIYEEPPKEELNSTYQGISVSAEKSLEAEYVTFRLRKGSTVKEYGQTTNTFSYNELEQGSYIIYQMKVFSRGLQIPFRAYTTREDGTKRPVESTSLILVNENELTKIILEGE